MRTRIRNAVLFLLGGAALVAAFVFATSRSDHPTQETSVLDAIPSDAQVVVVADLATLRRGPYRSLFTGRAVPSVMPSDEAACGKNLQARVERLGLWAPAEPGASFGIVARAPVSAESVCECAESTIAARGGTPVITEVEGFRVIADDRLGPGSAQIAVRDSGLLVLGRPATRSRMMDALFGRAPPAVSDGDHARMRKRLESPGDLSLSVVVSPPLRRRMAQWIGEPLPLLDEVTLFAAAVDLRDRTRLRAHVWCNSDRSCERLRVRLRSKRERMMRSLPMRAVGVAALVENMRFEGNGPELHIVAEASATQVLSVIERIGDLEEALGGQPAPVIPRPSGSAPDETLRPAPSASQ